MFNQEIVKKAFQVAERHNRIKAPFDISEITAIRYITSCQNQLEHYKNIKANCASIKKTIEEEVEDYLVLLTENNILTNGAAQNHLNLVDKLLTRWDETISEIERDYKARKNTAIGRFRKTFIEQSCTKLLQTR